VATSYNPGTTTIQKLTTRWKLINHGKTPAILKALHYRLFFTDDPGVLEYSPSYIDYEVAIPGGGIFPEDIPGVYNTLSAKYQAEHGEPNVAAVEISTDQSERIIAGKGFCVLLARTVYLDVFDRQHETASCRIYDGREGGTFGEHGGNKYNYRT
jgi:hypothetical protein